MFGIVEKSMKLIEERVHRDRLNAA
jgi:hypothetical protein